MKKIIVDTLGGDNGCEPIIRGSLRVLKELPDIGIILVGDESEITGYLSDVDSDRTEIIHTQQFVADSDLPTKVFKDAEDTSMVMAMKRLKNDSEAVGMVSAGNTGAQLVGSICKVGLIPGLLAPALATALPCKKDGLVCLVDCGANTECSAEDLKRYALMGNTFMQSLTGNPSPKVAMMSVGPSRHKGNALTKEAYGLIEKLPLNFIGNIEGSDLVNSQADVVVTDGFTGNVLLKNTEAAGLAAIEIIDEMGKNLPGWQEIRNRLHGMFAFNDLGGATFLGARKTMVKMHGCANEDTAYACVKLVLDLESRNFSKKIQSALQEI